MARSVFVTSAEGQAGKSTVALGLLQLLAREAGSVGIFRPVTATLGERDPIVELMLTQAGGHQSYESAIGVGYEETHGDEEEALTRIVERFHALGAEHDVVLVLGSDFHDVSPGAEASFNAMIAANLGTPVVLVVPAFARSAVDVVTAAELAVEELRTRHANPVAVVVNRADDARADDIRNRFETSKRLDGLALAGILPENPLLDAPTVGDLMNACRGDLVQGNSEWLHREAQGFLVAAMSMPNVLTRLVDDVTVIAPGDRYDILPGLVLAHQSGTFPALSSIVLTGGYTPPSSVIQLIEGAHLELPIIVTELDTFETTAVLSRVTGRMRPEAKAKVEAALRNFADHADAQTLLDCMKLGTSAAVTPLMFGHRLMDRARAQRMHIVLPEGDDPRVLEAADAVLRRGIADLTILGDELKIRSLASSIGADLSGANLLSPNDPRLVEEFATEYARLRAHKNISIEQARETVTDVSYFGTMMVHLGKADGMVSGAAHTTAHTIKPSFEIIKTVPGTNVVSSVFLMCLADEVLVYGDCAVNPDPTAEQLADIAISSARTAQQFDIAPRVAMLSYSTGSSGHGADVDKVRQATALVHEREPELLVEGPIQYDAAVEPSVAKSKMPDSPVAGQASVLIFPDLNTGNNTYKAVQRSAGAIAIGPVLQGLNKPVNDLSRGALVDDIINTVAITAIQAQSLQQGIS
ncbi:phosphate acetyltransferase [Yimella sp. NH-Cas1]|uniref:phosphate acetyltransferase n=1 Tax=Yimella sp. NH-Cas1 TaxID=2917726 RepID=UPI001EFB9747|nr:phosphate acetyltransferase [Yimella sp. NH-Cas1]MCG8656537.1 phosphate acetyltransferase [Yimella sp. NH-Cas1]